MIDQKILAGIMNLDDSNDVLGASEHKYAINIRFLGADGNERAESVLGNTEIPNEFLPDTGTNVSIGAVYDNKNQLVFWANYNSDALHGIYQLTLSTGAITYLILNDTNTDGDILEFTLDRVIHSMFIVYGDEDQGDVLCWLNSQKLPCQVNVKQALAGDYGTIKKSFIEVAKEIPQLPPQAVYEDNTDVTVNNLNENLFVFKTRQVFNNGDKSCWSAWSNLPLPYYFGAQLTNPTPDLNADIALVIPTGDSNTKKIEVAAARNLGTQYSIFFGIMTLDKAILSIPDNDIYITRFFNDKAYTDIDVEESIQLFDYVPLEANDGELLNGNTIIYGGIKEGYNPVTDFTNGDSETTNVEVDTEDYTKTQYQAILAAAQGGATLDGTGDIHIVVVGKIAENLVFTVKDQTDTITYTALAGDTTVEVIAGLSASAVGFGYTVTSSDDNNLYINKANALLKLYYLTTSAEAYSDTDAAFVYDWWSNLDYCLIYFDGKGVSCGAVTDLDLSFSTLGYSEIASVIQIPKIQANIWHRPPLEAEYYSWGRTKDLSKSKIIQWVSEFTFKDNVAGLDGNLYAYVGIENLNQYIRDKPAAAFLAYGFVPGDKIRFIKSYPTGGAVTPIIETDKVYEIQQSVTDPIINGTIAKGQYLKIFLPTTDVNFDFGVQLHPPIADAIDYNNYFIEIFRPSTPAADGYNRYFEFNERRAIGDIGLSTRFHQGMLQNQSTDLTVPATFEFTQGDDYFRQRIINAAPELAFTVLEQDIHVGNTIGMTADQDFSTVGYLVKDTPPASIFGSTTWLINVVDGNSYTFNIRGNIVVQVTADYPLDTFNITMLIEDSTFSSFIRVQVSDDFPTLINKVYDVTIDSSFTVPAGLSYVFPLIFGSGIFKILSGNLVINDTSRKFNQFVIDQNFSDSFQSAVNSNGREWIIQPNAKQIFNGALLRWGLAFQQGTDINQINRFMSLNFDEIDRAKGDIQVLKARSRDLRIFQNNGCGHLGIYTKFVQDSDGKQILTTTNDIITKNNIDYALGNVGVGTMPTSVVHAAYNDYFVNQVTGEQIRWGRDGLISISDLYKGEFYLKNLLVQYNKEWVRDNGGRANILGYFDYFEQQYVCLLQGGTNGEDAIDSYAFSFNEKRNAYASFYDYKFADWLLSVQDKLYSFKDGKIYIHNSTTYCNFFGVPYNPAITLVFNQKDNVKKTFLAISYQANQAWESRTFGDIVTSQLNDQTGLQQVSQLITSDYEVMEGIYYAAFLFDQNSMADAQVALVNGDILKGVWLECKLTCPSSIFAYLFLPYINWIPSPRNF